MRPLRMCFWLSLVLTATPVLAVEPDETAVISIEPLPGGDWQVEYRLDDPVEGLQFMHWLDVNGFLEADKAEKS